MSITLDTITHAVNSFNDIPDITFDSVDIGEFANEVEIYTNTPAVLIPTKLNAMAASMKDWLNVSIAAPLEAQQNTFKNEVVVRTNEAMTAVETYINNEVKAFVNDIFIPWANNSGVILSDNANLLESNISTILAQLQVDYTIHVQNQDAIIAQALADIETYLANFTTGAVDSGYSVHQTNELVADLVMTNPINPENYTFDLTGVNITSVTEGVFTTHHIDYDSEGDIISFGEALQIPGEVRPFVNHNVLTTDAVNDSISIEQVKAYSFTINTDAGGVITFRAIGHEADGAAAVDLTILNNTSIPDVDNPEITLTRGVQYAMLWDGIPQGDFVTIEDVGGSLFNEGVAKQYAVDGDTILFRPFASYCHDSVSEQIGWGVDTTAGAIVVEGEDHNPAFDSPVKCEQYFNSTVSILDDFSRSYEYDIPGESYDSALFDGMIYKVYISDDSGFVDSYNYTIDHNGKLGTGAVVTAVYDDGCSDITISSPGTFYSESTGVRILDVDAVATQATATIVVGDGTLTNVAITDSGEGFTGYWEVSLPDVGGAAAHTHTVHLTQSEVADVMIGSPVTKTTVDAGHTHDVTLVWNTFFSGFTFQADAVSGAYATGDHDHGMLSGGHEVNPTITVVITGDGAGATAHAVLNTADQIDDIVITNGGIGYSSVGIILSGGTPSTNATLVGSLGNNAIQSINITNPGAGYVDTSPEIIAIDLENSQFVPGEFTAKVGDTIRFTNTDLAGHTVEHQDGAFLSPNIPQNGIWDYVITKDTQLTDLYTLTGVGMGSGKMWVRESTVFIDVVSASGGGLRAIGSVDGAGTLINVNVVERGLNYNSADAVRILDCSGPGEGAYASPVIKRSLLDEQMSLDAGGSGYGPDTKIVVVDPTGYLDPNTQIRTFGSGGEVIPTITGGVLTNLLVTKPGQDYIDIDFIVVDPSLQGSGAAVSTGINSHVADIVFTSRGTGYVTPTPIVFDPSGLWGTTPTVGYGFVGTAILNDGVGAVTIIDDWADYIEGEARLTVVDIHPDPTGYGATGTISLNAQGAVSSIAMTDSGSAYKQPQVTIDGPVNYIGSAINNVDTDLALYGPKGNTDASPYSSGGAALTNYKNGVMVQWSNEQGHSLNDSWEFRLQSWIEGTPDNLVYKTYQYDGGSINTSGIIALKDVWDV